ncbi:MAG: LuxR C-terminal-related transcriptional regulator [Nitrosospira sp.]
MGKPQAEIASILEISCCTVKNHMQNLFRKLDAYNPSSGGCKAGFIPVVTSPGRAALLAMRNMPLHQ